MVNFSNDNRGATAILLIVIVSVAALIMAVGASILSMGEMDIGFTSQKGDEALSLADGCVEEGMNRLRTNGSYTGGSLNFGSGSCIISITSAGSDRTLTATGTIGIYSKKIQANITINSNVITVNSWQEVSN